jgi:hypothetical protein
MKNSKQALVALLAVLAVGSASAQAMKKESGYYGEVGYTPLSLGNSDITFKPKLARFIVGKDIHENLSIEGMYATTISKDSQQGVESSVSDYGIYLKPKLEVAKDTEIFGRLGFVRTQLKVSVAGASTSASESDVSYGFGAQTKFTKDIYGQLDYTNYYKKDGVTAKGFTLSIGTRF